LNLLWKLWELTLTNQSFMLIADSPNTCSEAIFSILSLISPLEYIGDYRPYFTICDPDFKIIIEESQRKMMRNIIIGVTNPLFLRVYLLFRFQN
jgi:hypothetical protein